MDPATPAPANRTFDALLALATLVLAFLLGSFVAGADGNADLWYHLAAGRLVAAGEYPFGSDPFSAHDPAPTWVNHSWLFDLQLFLGYRGLGGAAVVGIKAGLVVVLAFVLLRTRRRGGDGLWPAIGTVLALLAMNPRLVLQPSIASYVLFAALQLALVRPPRAKRWQLPVFVAVLFALWVNLDGGFWLGLLLIATRAIGAMLDRAVPLADPDAVEATSGPGELVVALGAALVGCLVNPYLHNALLSWPTEFAALRLPPELRDSPLFSGFFRSPLSDGYLRGAGPVAVYSLGILVVGGAVSFFVNAAGWRWGRALAWFAFVGLSLFLARLMPYAAIVAAPAFVMNVQAATARWTANRRGKLSAEAAHVLKFVGIFGRFVPLLAIGLLAYLAYPGWLAGDVAGTRGLRRVAWAIEPEPTLERLAQQFATWHAEERVRPGDLRGLHLAPDFAYYLAWFSPRQKSLFDGRLTAPPETWSDYLLLRKGILTPKGGEPGELPPEQLMEKLRLNYIVGSGDTFIERGVARNLFLRPDRWPFWAVAGYGGIFGFRDPAKPDALPKLTCDPVALALNPTAKVPSPPTGPPPTVPTYWDRYLNPTPPVPIDTHEATIWLTAGEAFGARAQSATGKQRAALIVWQLAGAVGQCAAGPMINLGEPLAAMQPIPSDKLPEAFRKMAPDNRPVKACALLALRNGRRAIAANPDDYEGYLRVVQAYYALQWPGPYATVQKLVAIRQTLNRLPLAEAAGNRPVTVAQAMQSTLFDLYSQLSAVPGGKSEPIDLRLDLMLGLNATMREYAMYVNPPKSEEEAKQYEARFKAADAEAEKFREFVNKRRDEYETRAAKLPATARVHVAAAYGLVKEALDGMRKEGAKEIDERTAELLVSLLLLAGEGDEALALANAPALKSQPGAADLRARAAAAVGDYATAIAALDEQLAVAPETLGRPLALVLQWLFFMDAPPTALARVATEPFWGGTWDKDQMREAGAITILALNAQQRFETLAQIGLLALERGDIAKSRTSLEGAVRPTGPGVLFPLRNDAAQWLEFETPRAVKD